MRIDFTRAPQRGRLLPHPVSAAIETTNARVLEEEIADRVGYASLLVHEAAYADDLRRGERE